MIQPVNSNPPDDAPEPLPQQEWFYRAPARFGSIPIEAEPKGWDRHRGFQKHYPRVSLPTQITERVRIGGGKAGEPNRLIWGDNLHVMRQIPTNSVDLIYIDPPFFSGKEYNVIWGDNNELRSFNDIWEGGLDGYLIWLNARIYEMKRMLKATGSIYIHCDWHASHYIKVEMDKIFGYENFLNEIIWSYTSGGVSKQWFGRKHDVIFLYAKNIGNHVIHLPQEKSYTRTLPEPHTNSGQKLSVMRDDTCDLCENGHPGQKYRMVTMRDNWADIRSLFRNDSEMLGYPTQKPEALLERIIKASSNEGDVVADFFVGGGTTAAVAQRLGRRWIACDQSRVAVAVTAERLKQQAQTLSSDAAPVPDFNIEQWGIYESDNLAEMPDADFREFVLQSYGRTRDADSDGEHIHGWRNQVPIWVGAPAMDSQATAADVRDFANAVRRTAQYQQANLRDGVMLAWGFRQDAAAAAEELRRLEELDVNFIRLKHVRIGDADFREHVVGISTEMGDYSEFLTFVRPPVVEVAHRALGGMAVKFDAGDSVSVNPGAEIINAQWDFDYDGVHFVAAPGYMFQRSKGKKASPQLAPTHKFPHHGKFTVACRLQDSRGGEGIWTGEVEAR